MGLDVQRQRALEQYRQQFNSYPGPLANNEIYVKANPALAAAPPPIYDKTNVALTDAIFQPLVARQVLNSRQADIQAAKNDALLMTADAYFQVHQYRGMYAGALYAVERGHDLVDRIARLSQDLVPRVEVDRARNLVADLEQHLAAALARIAELEQQHRDPPAFIKPNAPKRTEPKRPRKKADAAS